MFSSSSRDYFLCVLMKKPVSDDLILKKKNSENGF